MDNNREIPPRKPRVFYGWYIVGASWVMLFLVNALSVGIFFKPILEDEQFDFNRATLSAVQTGALLLMAALTPFIGRFIDRFGPRIMVFITLFAQAASGLLYGFSRNTAYIFAARFLYEIKALQASQVLINRWFVKKRGIAQGIAATGMPLGALILSPVSQYLILAWGWRETMFFWAGLTFIIALPLALIMRNRPEEKETGPDGARHPDTPDTLRAAWYTTDSGHTLAQAARVSSFWFISATQFICGIGCGFMMTHIVIFATDFNYPDMVGATLLSVQGAVNLAGVLLTGRFSDKYSRSKVLGWTHFIRSLSFFTAVIFIVLGGGPLWMLYLSMVFFGFGWFTTSPLTSGLIGDIFGGRSMGTIIGVSMACHTVGMAIGAYAGGLSYTLTGSYYAFVLGQGFLELLAAGFAFAVKSSYQR